MSKLTLCILLIAFLLAGCTLKDSEKVETTTQRAEVVDTSIDSLRQLSLALNIPASNKDVWNVITSSKHAKTLGNMFVEGAWVESDWQLGSDVHFKFKPDKVISTGKITSLTEGRYIQVDYNFSGFAYTEKYSIFPKEDGSSLMIQAGPYGEDFADQKIVWKKWLNKARELSVSQ